MIGVPPICQSADGKGGESNGERGRRRFDIVLSVASCPFAIATQTQIEIQPAMEMTPGRRQVPGALSFRRERVKRRNCVDSR